MLKILVSFDEHWEPFLLSLSHPHTYTSSHPCRCPYLLAPNLKFLASKLSGNFLLLLYNWMLSALRIPDNSLFSKTPLIGDLSNNLQRLTHTCAHTNTNQLF